MTELVRFLLLTADEAASLRGTSAPGHALEPRMIAAGPLAGWAVLPMAVLTDPAHAHLLPMLLEAVQADFDPAIAWPEEEEGR